MSQQTSLQQVPLTTQPSCVATAVPFRPSLPSTASPLSNGHRLPNGFQINRTGYQGSRTLGGFRGGPQKGGFRPGLKRKLEAGEEKSGKSLTEMMQPLYCKVSLHSEFTDKYCIKPGYRSDHSLIEITLTACKFERERGLEIQWLFLKR